MQKNFSAKYNLPVPEAYTLCLVLLIVCILFSPWQTKRVHAGNLYDINTLIGNRDSAFIADHRGKIVFSKNADKQLVPASTLKLLTSLVALNYLGKDYRFTTEFYLDKQSNLKIKGYGDPLLISEIIDQISDILGTKLADSEISSINDIVLDDSYFTSPIIIPGNSFSPEPYDAPNGALCANFNTINFERGPDGSYISAEPQTPLLPFALKKIKDASLNKGRIVLSKEKDEIILYAGHLFFYFLKNKGINCNGRVRLGRVHKDNDRLIYKHISKFSLQQIISKLLRYSNNFMANQLLVASGAKLFGSPGSLEKGVAAATRYAKDVLKIEEICLVEGSGLSRKNHISAKMLGRILEEFEEHRILMRRMGREFYKTGTLKGIATRAGYIENNKGELYRFVVMINTPGKSTQNIMVKILKSLN